MIKKVHHLKFSTTKILGGIFRISAANSLRNPKYTTQNPFISL